jgi:hypothetical protein
MAFGEVNGMYQSADRTRSARIARLEAAGSWQNRANLAAAGLSREEIAVRMGHASAATNGSHYTSGRKGWRSAKLRQLVPIASELRKQGRSGANMKAKIAKGQPLTRMEARELSGQSVIQSM